MKIGELIIPKKDIKYIKDVNKYYDPHKALLEVATYDGERFLVKETREAYELLQQYSTITIINRNT